MKHKVLFICKERLDDYGYDKSYGLINSSSFIVNYLNSVGVESKLVTVVDGNSIDREVSGYDPTHVIIEAIWVPPSKMQELLAIQHHRKRTWVVRIHSKIPFLACEGMAFEWLTQYKNIQDNHKNFYVSANTEGTTKDLHKVLGFRELFLPNIYLPTEYGHPTPTPTSEYLDFGCFGAIRVMKNQLIQAIAAIEYGNEVGKNIRFHINSTRIEGENSILKNLRALFKGIGGHQLIEHEWLNHKDFIQLVSSMHLGLQVSFSETFNIVAADFVSNNIPTVVSKEISWMPKLFQADPNSAEDIQEKIELIMSLNSNVLKINNIYLGWYNLKAKKRWDKFFKQ